MARRLERPNGRMLILMAAATVGFGLLQGARLVDVNSGPYSASPLALWGLVVDGAVFLAVAALSYAGKIEGVALSFSRRCSFERRIRVHDGVRSGRHGDARIDANVRGIGVVP